MKPIMSLLIPIDPHIPIISQLKFKIGTMEPMVPIFAFAPFSGFPRPLGPAILLNMKGRDDGNML